MDTSIQTVILRRAHGSDSLGFSLLGGSGFDFPPVVYDIAADSPAGRAGVLAAGDVLLSINEREVVKLSTKEVLKTLRLSGEIVNIKYKRDPAILQRVREFLAEDCSFRNDVFVHSSNGRRTVDTFVMTGDAILSLSRGESAVAAPESRTSPVRNTCSKLTPIPPTEDDIITVQAPPSPPPLPCSTPSSPSFPPPPDSLMAEEGDSSSLSSMQSDLAEDPASVGEKERPPGQMTSSPSPTSSLEQTPLRATIDAPSAVRLAKRLFQLDGFKPTDIWRHLVKSNEFTRLVAEEYLRHFDFAGEGLEASLRDFLRVCPLRGETSERERILQYFSSRFLACNPYAYSTQDSVHTLACALMLLNTDMYSSATGSRRMTCKDFIANLQGLNEGADFDPVDLRRLYEGIRAEGLGTSGGGGPEGAEDDVTPSHSAPASPEPQLKDTKRGYVRKKWITERGGRRAPLFHRGWSLHYIRLQALQLLVSAGESAAPSATLKLHHCYAQPWAAYTKRPFVFRLSLADGSEYLMQTADAREMSSWLKELNGAAALWSMEGMEKAIGSNSAPTLSSLRPLLPSGCGRGERGAQLEIWRRQLQRLEAEQRDQQQQPLLQRLSKRERKAHAAFCALELRRYSAYIEILENSED